MDYIPGAKKIIEVVQVVKHRPDGTRVNAGIAVTQLANILRRTDSAWQLVRRIGDPPHLFTAVRLA